MSWEEQLAPSTKTDMYLRLGATLLLLLFNVFISTHLKTPFPEVLVEAYGIPLTRLFLLLLLIAACFWCPTVGILFAFAYVCLASDVLITTKNRLV